MEWRTGCCFAKVNVFENFHVKFLNENFASRGHWFLELNLKWADSTVTSEEMSAFKVFELKEGKKIYGPI
jgi:hypothetical protein